MAGAATHQHRRSRETGGVSQCAGGAGEVGHRDARTGACRRADGHALSRRRAGGVDRAALRARVLDHPRQSRDRRECRSRISSGTTYCAESSAGADENGGRYTGAAASTRGLLEAGPDHGYWRAFAAPAGGGYRVAGNGTAKDKIKTAGNGPAVLLSPERSGGSYLRLSIGT